MTKCTLYFKQQVLKFYLQNDKNRSLFSQHFQLAEHTIRRWINQYNHNGINVLTVLGKSKFTHPNLNYPLYKRSKTDNFPQYATLYFGIANLGIISQWLQAFDQQDINDLFSKPKGHFNNETEISQNNTTT